MSGPMEQMSEQVVNVQGGASIALAIGSWFVAMEMWLQIAATLVAIGVGAVNIWYKYEQTLKLKRERKNDEANQAEASGGSAESD